MLLPAFHDDVDVLRIEPLPCLWFKTNQGFFTPRRRLNALRRMSPRRSPSQSI